MDQSGGTTENHCFVCWSPGIKTSQAVEYDLPVVCIGCYQQNWTCFEKVFTRVHTTSGKRVKHFQVLHFQRKS